MEKSQYEKDLEQKLKNPEYRAEFERGLAVIRSIDKIINDLDDARKSAKMSKADLARLIDANPSSIRRIFSSGLSNPTLSTIAELASALDFELVLQPKSNSEAWLKNSLKLSEIVKDQVIYVKNGAFRARTDTSHPELVSRHTAVN